MSAAAGFLLSLCIVLFPLSVSAQAWRISVLGDSLATGYGIAPESAYPARLEALAAASGIALRVSVVARNGATTAWGRTAVAEVALQRPHVAVVALGGNDMLAQRAPLAVATDLEAILHGLRSARIPVLLCGMRAYPEWSDRSRRAFEDVWPAAARRWRVPLVPFILEGVARRPALNLPDGIHPNEAGSARIAETIWRALHPLLVSLAR